MRVMITNEAYRLADKIPFQEPEKLEYLTAARGQEAAFQIILFPEENCDLCLEAEPRIYGGIGYPAYRLEVCSAYTPTVWAEGMLCDDEGIKRADILLSDRKIGMKSGRPFAVWAQLTVPEEAQKKDSEVTVRIWETEGNKDEKPVLKNRSRFRFVPTRCPGLPSTVSGWISGSMFPMWRDSLVFLYSERNIFGFWKRW